MGLAAFSLGTMSSNTPALAELGRATNTNTAVNKRRRVKAGHVGCDFIVPSLEAALKRSKLSQF